MITHRSVLADLATVESKGVLARAEIGYAECTEPGCDVCERIHGPIISSKDSHA